MVLSVLAALVLFVGSERTVVIASHDAVVSPDFSGKVVLHTGPVLPDLRIDSGSVFGLDIRLGKTDATSTEALVQRYALLASQPKGQEAKVRQAIVGMAYDAALRGAVIGIVPLLIWLLIGSQRRRLLVRRIPTKQGVLAIALVVAMGAALWAPWDMDDDETLEDGLEWQSLPEFLGPAIPVPDEVKKVEIQGNVTTAGTRRLIESAVDTYQKSLEFYSTAAEAAEDLELRGPEDDETVVALVSDRHDNIGMDDVARAVADAAGATAVFNAGDDTSTGEQWEAFSLDSVTAAFEDFDDRWGVAGNHDNGPFVADYLSDQGWTMLDGEIVDGPGDSRLLGVADPRSSGLGNWRDETGLSFDEVGSRLADAACDADEDGDRVNTILVHDANLGDEALARGCVDLVVGGHVHVQEGPTQVAGEGDAIGWTYTTGTTGGAAYAVAIGSKLRRPAEISLITYADGKPVGLQAVMLQTNGVFDVSDYLPLTYEPVEE